MAIQLSDHFDYKRLIQFVLPSIGMMVFTSIYGVVDGFFVSNFAGSRAFAAVNLILPFAWIFSSIGFMVGTGGTALISYHLGQGKRKKANEIFSFLIYFVIVLGALATLVGELILPRMAVLLGATEGMLPDCVRYGRIIIAAQVPFMLQNLFQSFLVLAERPRLGFLVTVLSGVTNMALDALFVGVFKWGVTGAAVATALSQCVGGIIPLIYFIFPNKSILRLGKTRFDGRALLKTLTNGSSEFLTNISLSVVNMLYNIQAMKFAGEDGVAAYGVVMYVAFCFIAVFIGYSIGTAPIVGYNYGADNKKELKNVYKKSIKLVALFSVAMFVLALLFARPLALLYVGYDEELIALTMDAFRCFSACFLVMGFSIYGSSFFTALNNGLVSAIISFMRTLVFQVAMVLILPALFGLPGVWWANAAAELLSLFVTVFFWILMRKKYGYA